MNALSRLKIAARLGLGFGLQLTLIAGIVVAVWVYLGRINTEGEQLLEVEWTKVAAVNRIDTLTRANARATMELFFADGAKRQEIRARIAANKGAIDEAVEVLDRLIRLEEGKRLLADVKRTRGAYVASFQKIPGMLDAGQRDEASALLAQETLPLLDQLQAPINALLALQEKVADQRGEAMQAATTAATRATVLLGVLALALGLAAAWLLSQSVVVPLRSAIDLAGRIARGDLGNRIVITGTDETAELLGALEAMQGGLRDLVGQVRGGVEEVSSASGQISAANLDLSARTESQASALEQTAASMEQLTGAISNNAENAREANRLAVGAAGTARSGGEVVGNVVTTMHAVNESSQRIREIIGVIDGIAFQTNLLALNAAVEAARAGEEGRGFAVVAGEVRALASRSADAARQIKSLIDQSVSRAEEGSRLADRAGQAMTEVVGAIERVSAIVGDISAATTEQQAGVSQVGQAVTQLDEATQQNAALVEQTAAASKSLDEQARQLVAAIAVFRTGDGDAGRGSRAQYMPRAAASLAHQPEHPNAWE